MRPFATIICILILASCAPKAPAPEVLQNGVRFSYLAPKAKSVAIAGNFNQWSPTKDRLSGPDRNGIWTIVLPLPPGRYEYQYVVDGGAWMPDPSAPSVDDEFGGRNSLFTREAR